MRIENFIFKTQQEMKDEQIIKFTEKGVHIDSFRKNIKKVEVQNGENNNGKK